MTTSITLFRDAVRRLTEQFHWGLLTESAWVEAAAAIEPEPINVQAARRVCLTVYSCCLFNACQDLRRRNQAYQEIYNYAWPQAYHLNKEMAAAIANNATARVFYAFAEPADSKKRPRSPNTFLRFIQFKLVEAWRDEVRHTCSLAQGADVPFNQVLDPYEGDLGAPVDWLKHPGPSIEEIILEGETKSEAWRWLPVTVQAICAEVLSGLRTMWTDQHQRRVIAITLTYLDRLNDDLIADELMVSHQGLHNLRANGLNELRGHLRTHLTAILGDHL
jgi:hypothetical protein